MFFYFGNDPLKSGYRGFNFILKAADFKDAFVNKVNITKFNLVTDKMFFFEIYIVQNPECIFYFLLQLINLLYWNTYKFILHNYDIKNY